LKKKNDRYHAGIFLHNRWFAANEKTEKATVTKSWQTSERENRFFNHQRLSQKWTCRRGKKGGEIASLLENFHFKKEEIFHIGMNCFNRKGISAFYL
jgi:hypothetical protein